MKIFPNTFSQCCGPFSRPICRLSHRTKFRGMVSRFRQHPILGRNGRATMPTPRSNFACTATAAAAIQANTTGA